MNDKSFEQLLESVNQAEETIRKLEEKIDDENIPEGDMMKQECNHGLKLLTDGTCPLCIAEAMPQYYIPLMGSHISEPAVGLMTRYGKVTLP